MMRHRQWIIPAVVAMFAVLVVGARLRAKAATPSTAEIVVTAETKNNAPAQLRPGDVTIRENQDRVAVTSVTPLAGLPVEMYVAIDDSVDGSFPSLLPDVAKFINSQSSNVAVGLVYLRDGGVDIRQKPTTDHAMVAKALSLPLKDVGISPFESVVALLKQWPHGAARREIVMISSGIEPFGGVQMDNPIVDQAIAAVQRAEVPVFAIYAPASGHWGHTFWRETWGQDYLSRLADESGGEGYNLTGLTEVTLTPYLNDITQRLQNQYRVAFTPKPQSKPGFEIVRASTEVPHVDLDAPDRAWIGGAE